MVLLIVSVMKECQLIIFDMFNFTVWVLVYVLSQVVWLCHYKNNYLISLAIAIYILLF